MLHDPRYSFKRVFFKPLNHPETRGYAISLTPFICLFSFSPPQSYFSGLSELIFMGSFCRWEYHKCLVKTHHLSFLLGTVFLWDKEAWIQGVANSDSDVHHLSFLLGTVFLCRESREFKEKLQMVIRVLSFFFYLTLSDKQIWTQEVDFFERIMIREGEDRDCCIQGEGLPREGKH